MPIGKKLAVVKEIATRQGKVVARWASGVKNDGGRGWRGKISGWRGQRNRTSQSKAGGDLHVLGAQWTGVPYRDAIRLSRQDISGRGKGNCFGASHTNVAALHGRFSEACSIDDARRRKWLQLRLVVSNSCGLRRFNHLASYFD